MNIAKLNAVMCGVIWVAALMAAPAVSTAQDSSAKPVACKDGTTAAHGGRGAAASPPAAPATRVAAAPAAGARPDHGKPCS